jgi:hypothetical protein
MTEMNIVRNIARFEAELSKVERPGMDKLLDYIRKSDFYTAPASTKYHLACEGGLLQHSLNVLDALRGLLSWRDGAWEYQAAGATVDTIPDDSVIIMALLHDICKTYFYSTSTRNAKNETTGKWEKVPYYTVKDRMPLGHGDKSVMIIKQYIILTSREMYAIWHHMGFTDSSDNLTLTNAIEAYPVIWALHTADMMASHMMEGSTGNLEAFTDPEPESAGEYADSPATDADGFMEAPPLMEA